MKGLIAKRPILYRGRMYRDGENLPGDDTRMVAAWLENDSAELRGEDKSADQGGQEPPQEPESAPEVSEGQGAGNEAQGGQEPPQEAGEHPGGIRGYRGPGSGRRRPGGPGTGRRGRNRRHDRRAPGSQRPGGPEKG